MRKTCPGCHAEFLTRYRKQKACSLACRGKVHSLTVTGRKWSAKKRASTQARIKARVQDATYEKFGDLSERDIALFNAGARIGYYRGWNRARETYQTSEAA